MNIAFGLKSAGIVVATVGLVALGGGASFAASGSPSPAMSGGTMMHATPKPTASGMMHKKPKPSSSTMMHATPKPSSSMMMHATPKPSSSAMMHK